MYSTDDHSGLASLGDKDGLDAKWYWAFLFSCFMAFLVNASFCFITGKLNAVTYQVIGHTKTLLTLISGVFLFRNTVSARQATGMFIAGVGVGWYTYAMFWKPKPAPGETPAAIELVKAIAPDAQKADPETSMLLDAEDKLDRKA
eukprot:CAMPEP_0196661926 /NCGR_PEP_ID=MMETSP1086-20130531/46460_1 /TAXON_ID=77921 /ORGANISM="Cyanoptyche  gloeocystis , Strain SAG4.97" /LENGTH=144 /DNA_ID=CAMNT_0041997063 /DNA_START=701 /DNA_END=1135 /DNA_ORIENTATION=+